MAPNGKQMFMLTSFALMGTASASACMTTQEDWDAWYSSIMVGSVIGGVIAVLVTVLAALPLRFGILKPQGKSIAVVSIALGIFMIFVPAISGMAASSSAVSNICGKCDHTCTDEEKKAIRDGFAALGVLAAYIGGTGWLALIMGIVASSLGCGICCNCYKMAPEPQAEVLVGQAVQAGAVGKALHNELQAQDLIRDKGAGEAKTWDPERERFCSEGNSSVSTDVGCVDEEEWHSKMTASLEIIGACNTGGDEDVTKRWARHLNQQKGLGEPEAEANRILRLSAALNAQGYFGAGGQFSQPKEDDEDCALLNGIPTGKATAPAFV